MKEEALKLKKWFIEYGFKDCDNGMLMKKITGKFETYTECYISIDGYPNGDILGITCGTDDGVLRHRTLSTFFIDDFEFTKKVISKIKRLDPFFVPMSYFGIMMPFDVYRNPDGTPKVPDTSELNSGIKKDTDF